MDSLVQFGLKAFATLFERDDAIGDQFRVLDEFRGSFRWIDGLTQRI